MEGVIVNFRRARHHTYHNQLIVYPLEQVEVEKLIGKTVIYNTGKKKIEGKIVKKHGKKGLRVLFPQGMPGQCLGKKVVIK